MLPTHLTNLMTDNSIFIQGHGLLTEESLKNDIHYAANLLVKAEQGIAKGQKIATVETSLKLADEATRLLAKTLQQRMGSAVRLSACLGLARSLVEEQFTIQRALG